MPRKVARDAGLGGRINTVLQTCFFAISGVLPRDEAIARIKDMIRKTYGRKGGDVVAQNFAAVDQTLAHLHEVDGPQAGDQRFRAPADRVRRSAPDFVQKFTAGSWPGAATHCRSALMPVDGTFPSGTAAWEKRNIADDVPVWDPDLCIQCGQCGFVCPHSRHPREIFTIAADQLGRPRPRTSNRRRSTRAAIPTVRFTLQFYVEDCTGCGLCVEACPAHSPSATRHAKRSTWPPRRRCSSAERANIAFFETLPVNDRARVDFANVRGIQFLEPLFEFSGACAGCGETPYLQAAVPAVRRPRCMIANATGCSSIYGGNLPVTPWTENSEGRGPAWSNSLFEDNAEFGLGFRLAADMHVGAGRAPAARAGAAAWRADLVEAILTAPQIRESEIRAQRGRVAELTRRLPRLGRRARGARSPFGGRSSRSPQHLARRRRRLGL